MGLSKELEEFKAYLVTAEKSSATIEKYLRDVKSFLNWGKQEEICKERVLAYKEYLGSHYAPVSANSMLASLNSYLKFLHREDCCVKSYKIQRQIFCNEEKELSKAEYQRLLKAAKNSRTAYVLQTICLTGIRVSELQFVTVEALQEGKAVVDCKSKRRVILFPTALRKQLLTYAKQNGIVSGPVFITRNGKVLDRSNIWRDMKMLCKTAKVESQKVFPHNLRHLFARMFYSIERDIVRLADILGHSNVNTTRVYTMESGCSHMKRLTKVETILMT